ncbi:anti-sigma factor family protein [Streptomyces sp. NPDC101112]|uniref:anti-sigma factor family protein n=1 Tax=Streptomyces sp. NPDC101112 TaxID=3366105 RepID=UPI00381B4EE7
MTSTTDTAGHPDVEEISDLTEGLLPPSRTEDVRQHLDECSLCADVYASLEEIRGMLGTLPGPPRMPDDVAGRIDAALAAEALLSATTPDQEIVETAEASDSSGTTGTTSRADDGVHVSRETSTAADRPAGHGRGPTGPGRSTPRRRTRHVRILAAVFATATLGLGVLLVQSMNDSGSGENSPSAQSPASDVFSGVKLQKRVDDLLGGQTTKDAPGRDSVGANTAPEDPERFDSNPTTKLTKDVPPCIAKGIGDVTGAIASEPGTYQGADAYLVLLPVPKDASHVTAYVVDASCVGKTSAPAGKVLLKQTYSRP